MEVLILDIIDIIIDIYKYCSQKKEQKRAKEEENYDIREG